MGTNYYARFDICPTCKRYKELHIGKSSVGWRFHFQAHEKWDDDACTDKPYLSSAAEWQVFLASGPEVWDEYDEQMELEKFWAFVQTKQGERHPLPGETGTSEYHDPEGYLFDRREFS